MKRTLVTIAALAVASMTAASALASSPSTGVMLIRHQTQGCHAWSVSGGPFAASQTVLMSRGGSLTVQNYDVMPHLLVHTGGPAAKIVNVKGSMMGSAAGATMGGNGMGMSVKVGTTAKAGLMNYMGATTKVTFPKSGTYTFTTKPGEDYMTGIKTTGEDNVLKVTVVVA